jgi:hypothetical protein
MANSIRLKIEGLDELRAALQQLPADLAADASEVVAAVAQSVDREIIAGYPTGPTGHLKQRVSIDLTRGRVFTGATIRSRAPHATIFERGTRVRQTRRGANRGQMPAADPAQAMIPKMIRARRRLYEALADVLRQQGFEVEL